MWFLMLKKDYFTERVKSMNLDTDGKSIFTFICNQFADLRFDVKDNGAKRVFPFLFQRK